MLAMRIKPKISVSPLASKKRSRPNEIPFNPCWRTNGHPTAHAPMESPSSLRAFREQIARSDAPRRRRRGLPRVPDRISEVPLRHAIFPRVVQRVGEHRQAEPLTELEQRRELRRVQVPPPDVRADVHAPAPRAGGALGFRDGGVHILEREGGERHEPQGVRPADRGDLVVENLRQVASERGGRPVEHRRGEGERLQRDPPAVQRLEPRGHVVEHRPDPGGLMRAVPDEPFPVPGFDADPMRGALALQGLEKRCGEDVAVHIHHDVPPIGRPCSRPPSLRGHYDIMSSACSHSVKIWWPRSVTTRFSSRRTVCSSPGCPANVSIAKYMFGLSSAGYLREYAREIHIPS